MKKALICGISGQDGAYLAKLLLDKRYEVFGTSRDAQTTCFSRLEELGISDSISYVSMAPTDFRSVLQTIAKVEPDEIYNLSGQSSVGLSFEQPVETMDSISKGTLNILEAIRFYDTKIKFYSAGSSECFGDTGEKPADELTAFNPRSPYAVAKSAAFWQVANYREAYNIYACTGILFNHDSPFRPRRFVTKKIVSAALEIALGRLDKLVLGNLNVIRDWGWAPEYVNAMWLMLQHCDPDDYVVATGESHSLLNFVQLVFEEFNLDWEKYVVLSDEFSRPLDIKISRGNPKKANENLRWKAETLLSDIVKKMVEYEVNRSRIE